MKTMLSIVLTLALVTAFQLSRAQEKEKVTVKVHKGDVVKVEHPNEGNIWNQGRRGVYSLGLSGVQQIVVSPYHGLMLPGMGIDVQGEYGVGRRKVVGLGWETGMNFYFHRHVVRTPEGVIMVETGPAVVQIPLGFITNVHILDAARKYVRGLDVYAGFNIGGGPGFYADGTRPALGMFYAGPQAGVRYWWSPRAAFNAEFGWGARFAKVGFTF